MASIAIIGGSVCDDLDKKLAERMTQRLVSLGHQVYHGGIDSGIMQASFLGGGIGIVYQKIIDEGRAVTEQHELLVNTSVLKYQFPGFPELDFGHAIRRHLLVDASDLVIAFDGGIGTYDELLGRFKTKKKLAMIGNFSPHIWALVNIFAFSGINVGKILMIKRENPFESILSDITRFLEL